MKSYISTIIFLCFMNQLSFAHGQGVHQHMVRQAYQLLKNYVGQDIREMQNHIGYDEHGSQVFDPGDKIVIGAYREDEEDPVYQNSFPFGWTVTCTHFWEPDNGDGSHFIAGNGVSYHNAYEKALNYLYEGTA